MFGRVGCLGRSYSHQSLHGPQCGILLSSCPPSVKEEVVSRMGKVHTSLSHEVNDSLLKLGAAYHTERGIWPRP